MLRLQTVASLTNGTSPPRLSPSFCTKHQRCCGQTVTRPPAQPSLRRTPAPSAHSTVSLTLSRVLIVTASLDIPPTLPNRPSSRSPPPTPTPLTNGGGHIIRWSPNLLRVAVRLHRLSSPAAAAATANGATLVSLVAVRKRARALAVCRRAGAGARARRTKAHKHAHKHTHARTRARRTRKHARTRKQEHASTHTRTHINT